MAAAKRGTPGYERLKAHRIRKLIEAGKATPEKISWLKAYEERKFSTATPPSHVTTQTVESNPIEAQATSVPQTAPPPMEVPPLGSAMPAGHGIPADPVTAGTATTETNDSTPSSATSPASQKEAAVTAIVDMAAQAWKAGMDKIAVMTGSNERMFPDDFVDKIWKPAATRLGVKYLPDSMGSDLADAVIVVGPPAVTALAARRVASQLKAAEQGKAEIAAKPAGEPPQEVDAPHAQTPPTANGEGRMNKNDIRRAKAPELPKDAVF